MATWILSAHNVLTLVCHHIDVVLIWRYCILLRQLLYMHVIPHLAVHVQSMSGDAYLMHKIIWTQSKPVICFLRFLSDCFIRAIPTIAFHVFTLKSFHMWKGCFTNYNFCSCITKAKVHKEDQSIVSKYPNFSNMQAQHLV